MMREAGLNDTLTALILVYIAQGLPMSIFILSEFVQQIPKDLRDAARCDGVPETRIFFEVIAPLLGPPSPPSRCSPSCRSGTTCGSR